ncbi:MAG: DUF1800 family protein [Candidatus Rokubacteria bacterium]|nr:DUF1800 family protein [Candidatus Rokubacteria bacterium]
MTRMVALVMAGLLAAACAGTRPADGGASRPVTTPAAASTTLPTLSDRDVVHLLARATFGPRPGDVERVRRMGAAAWLDGQLAPNSLDDAATAAALASLPTLAMPTSELLRRFPRPDAVMREKRGAARLAAANGARYPRGPFGESMRQIAQLVRADVGLEVAFADMGGFDTHAAQGAERGPLAARLTEFGTALAAFARDLGDRLADVVVLTMSEFGRTVAENGSRGTDHGHATAMLVLGGGVRGGRVYGRWPGLAREQLFEGRDLAVTTDFRALFSEVATGHVGVPATAPVFPGWRATTPLGLFSQV